MKKVISKNPLFYAFLLPAIVDGFVTILGQGKQYWINPIIASDASPAYYVLIISPYLFIFGSMIWFGFWYWLLKMLKEPFNIFMTFTFIAAHSWGSSSWLMKMMREAKLFSINYQTSIILAWLLLICYFALIATAATFCLQIYMENRKLTTHQS